jgi:uncharacterized protein YacL
MALIILRSIFLAMAGGLATLLTLQAAQSSVAPPWTAYAIFIGIMGLASGIILLDIALPRKRIETVSAIYFGVLVGVMLTWVLSICLTPLTQGKTYENGIRLVLGMVMCYGCTTLLLQTKDNFRFLIPYVEFVRESKSFRPLILDTSVVIDGRIEDLVGTGIFDNQLVVPRFALTELQAIADSSDRLRRARGRRGLDVLSRLQNNDAIDLQILEREPPELDGQTVDLKLVLLAKALEGKIVTGDFNLNKVARLHHVPVINLNELANSLKPVFLPGEAFRLRVVKVGENPEQGVGYLDDGTMVVVEGGRESVGREVDVLVTSTLQTSAGRMIFARHENPHDQRR